MSDKSIKTNLSEGFIKILCTFLKWIFISTVIGIIVGAVGSCFHHATDFVAELRHKYTWLIYFLPIGGLVIVLLYHLCRMDNDKGTNDVLLSIKENKKLSVFMAPLIFVTSTITHLFGGSSGREGAALQIGGSIAQNFGRLFKLDENDKKIITMCGMSGAFAAVFGTPVTAAIFAIEIVNVGSMCFSALLPCVISAIAGSKISLLLGISPVSFKLSGIPELELIPILKITALSILTAILSIVFCEAMHKSKKIYSKFLPNKYLRISVAGVLVVILTLIVGSYDYNGTGMDIVSKAISGEAKNEAFILKILFTAVTLGGGYKGGEIVPVFFTGATFGNTIGKLINLSPSFCAGIGVISLFCGVTNCPITSFILSIELFGSEGIIYFMLSCALSYMLSGYHSLYKEQKILYSKIKFQLIDKKAH